MDCYFHSNVPSIAACGDCRKPICATCRDDAGTCPSCRLAAKVDAAAATRGQIGGTVYKTPPNQPPPYQNAYQEAAGSAAVRGKAEVATAMDPVESRALVALGYPLWPLALISLLDRKQSKYLKRQAIQALDNVGMAASRACSPWHLLRLSAVHQPARHQPLLHPDLPDRQRLLASRRGRAKFVPLISDWLNRRLPAN